MFKNEAEFEAQLIEALTHGEISLPQSGDMDDGGRVYKSRLWKYEKDLKTTEQLWENFKQILELHNQDKLEGPLSQAEFAQVRKEIENLRTPYQAGQFLYGYNGVSQIEVNFDDGRHDFLTVFDQAKIGAGDTVYQIVNQINRKPVLPGKRNCRFDVTLLINGLPILQIELKHHLHDVNEALNQMNQYIEEEQYSDIFSTVQVLVGMTPTSIKYMANTVPGAFNTAFAFEWRKDDNTPVHDWKVFADEVLSIPAAHNLTTNFIILDRSKEAIRVMRPYQIRATKKVLSKIRNLHRIEGNKVGYIWHTTGSGKTITSFKTAFLASKMPLIEKVVFAVDRKSLTKQTFDNYLGYDPDADQKDYKGIADTANTGELAKRLRSGNNGIVITSIQKLQRLTASKSFKAPEKNILFIVDEAHRSTGSEIFNQIQSAFPYGYWLGYTGTPVFGEHKGFPNTGQIFGPCLDTYTIREGIADKNVLGFKVDFKTTIPEDEVKNEQLPAFYKRIHPEWDENKIREKIEHMKPEDFDDAISSSFYDENPKHIQAVVDDMMFYWDLRSVNRRYNALLTTHVGSMKRSSPMAMMYFREFQKRNQQLIEEGKEPLKIAVTFAQDLSNSEEMTENNKGLSEAIAYYNSEFGTSFSDQSVEDYRQDVEDRLQHKSSDGKHLDLCIVVDQLLTGFDAPSINTLYVDRTLKGSGLIQAYSRTNRVEDMNYKQFGHIINYRWPKQNENEMNKALALYSNRNLKDSEITEWEGWITDIVTPPLPKVLEEARKVVDELRELTNDFTKVPESEGEAKKTLDLLRKHNRTLEALKQYPQDDAQSFDPSDMDSVVKLIGMTPEESDVLQSSLANQLKTVVAAIDGVQPSDIDLFVIHVKDVVVNYDYITELLRDLMIYVHDGDEELAENTRQKINDFAMELDDRSYARDIHHAADAIERKLYPDEDSNLEYPYDNFKEIDLVAQASHAMHLEDALEFIRKWGLQNVITPEYLWQLICHHQYGKQDLKADKVAKIRKDAAKRYKDYSTDPKIRALPLVNFRLKIYDSLYELADQAVSEVIEPKAKKA